MKSTTVAALGAVISRESPRAGPLHESNTIQLALIGCGGRGGGAMANAIEAGVGPVKLVAMADVFADRLNSSHHALAAQYADKIDVPPDRRFVGFQAYRDAINCLKPGDIAVLATHAAFRATHLEYAVARGVNVFMEKSFAPDPAGIQKILHLGEQAESKNLKIATGLMCRHSTARQELINRIREGALGEIQLIRAYRMDAGDRMGPFHRGENELHWQIRHPYFFFWVSTGRLIDYLIHQVDECCWIKDGFPVSAQGFGGRVPNSSDCSQNLDTYAIEYTFADGTKAQVNGRFIPGCDVDFGTYLHGTRSAAQFSGNVHAPITQIYRDQRIAHNNVAWRPAKETVSPYVAEWRALLTAVRKDEPHNETRRSALANLAAIMGRAAVHSGKTITWADATASTFQFCTGIDALTDASAAPVQADAQGRYPVPIPGEWRET